MQLVWTNVCVDLKSNQHDINGQSETTALIIRIDATGRIYKEAAIL